MPLPHRKLALPRLYVYLPSFAPLTFSVEGSYVAVSNLTDTYSFFSRVYDTQDFDRYGLQYINNIAETKLADTMGCNNADSTVIRYERTVLCGIWTSSAGALACNQYYRESGHSEGVKAFRVAERGGLGTWAGG